MSFSKEKKEEFQPRKLEMHKAVFGIFYKIMIKKVNLMSFSKEKKGILSKETGNAGNSVWNILQSQEIKRS